MKKKWYILFAWLLYVQTAHAQCSWYQAWSDDFEYTTTIPGIVAGVAFQNSPATWTAHSGTSSMYLNFVNTLGAGSMVYNHSVTVCPSLPTRVSCWMTTTFAGLQCDMQIQIKDGFGAVMCTVPSTVCPYSPNWVQFVSPSFTTASNTVQISFFTNVGGSPAGNDVSIDDLLIEQCISSDTLLIPYGTVCQNAASLNLFSLLSPGTPVTGTWNGPDALSGGHLGTFNPATNAGGSYAYNAFPSSCSNDTTYIVSILKATPPSLSTSHTHATSGNNGTATVTATGNGPFTYAWSPVGGSSNTISGLSPGSYTVVVTDVNGCISTALVVIGSGNTCNWHSFLSDSYEYSTSCPDVIAGTTYQTAPATWAAKTGTKSLYLNFVDSSSANGTHAGDLVYERTINTCPGLPIQISNWLTTTFAGSQCNVRISITDGSGSVLADTLSIAAPYYPTWHQYVSPSIIPSANSVIFRMYTNKGGGPGNDLSMDDFAVDQCYEDIPAVKIPYGNICENELPLALYALLTDTPAVGGNWNGPSALTGGYTGTFTPSTNTSGTYVYTSFPYGNAPACPLGKDTVTIAVKPQPQVAVLKTNATCGNADGTAHVDSTALGSTPPYQYNWTGGQITSALSALAPGTYTVTVTDANQCSDSASAVVGNTAGLIQATLTKSDITCYGEQDGIAAINATATGYTYEWNTNPVQYTQAVTGLDAGNYEVIIRIGGTCDSTFRVTIAEPDSLHMTLSLTNASCSAGGSATTVVSGGRAPYSYLWSNGEQSSYLGPVVSGTYGITVTDANQCIRSESFVIDEDTCQELTIYIPSSFTPNGDGRNDFFNVNGTHFSGFTMEIFDRWGKPLFRTTDISQPWYGTTDEGKAVPMGVYVYQVTVVDFEDTPHEYTGSVTLYR